MKNFKNRLLGLGMTMLLTAAICITQAQGASKLPIVRIGVVRDGLSVRFPENVVLFQQEILDLTSGEFDVRFPPDKSVQGNWTVAGVKRAVDRLLADPKVDLILALGAIASNEICQRRNLPKPVIASLVIDAELQGLPLREGASGVKNLTYINSFNSLKRDVRTFREIVPFSRLAVLVDTLILEAFRFHAKFLDALPDEDQATDREHHRFSAQRSFQVYPGQNRCVDRQENLCGKAEHPAHQSQKDDAKGHCQYQTNLYRQSLFLHR